VTFYKKPVVFLSLLGSRQMSFELTMMLQNNDSIDGFAPHNSTCTAQQVDFKLLRADHPLTTLKWDNR
jgi:hypothetical protein